MKVLGLIAASVLLAGSLVACGGGGGGGGGPGAGASAPAVASTPAAGSLALTVRINDSVAPGADAYAVKDGDTVEVSANSAVGWTSSGPGVTLGVKSISSTTWKVTLMKSASAPTSVTLTASSGSTSKTLTFNLAATDARNGIYRVYATNGSRLDLRLNFDANTYAFSNSTVGESATSGSFSADDAENGTFVFSSPRNATGRNTARFRVKGDVVLGAFPFVAKQKSDATFEVRPFVASRSLATDRRKFDGTYNRFGINLSPASSDISQFEISSGGTVLKRCRSADIYRIDNCPAESVVSYGVIPGTAEGTWQLTDSNGAIAASFGMVPVDGKYVLLMAGISDTGLPDTLFRIGLPESKSWPTGAGYGSATTGSWGKVELLGNGTSTRTGFASDGTAINTLNPLSPLWSSGPYGMRSIVSTVDSRSYFAMQGAGIFAIVGARDAATNGYLQLSLLD